MENSQNEKKVRRIGKIELNKRNIIIGIIILVIFCCLLSYVIVTIQENTPEGKATSSAEAIAKSTTIFLETEEAAFNLTEESKPTVTPEATETSAATDTPEIASPEPTDEPITIETSEGLMLNIPGYAFIDGRDLESDPPLTIMTINIWDSFTRNSVVCTLAHGSEVELLDANYVDSESRYYLLVRGDNCEGWLSDPFLSLEKEEPVGDKF